METSLDQFVARHRAMAATDQMRLGQRFVNEFIKGTGWTELFYERDDRVALEMIKQLLTDLQYYPGLSPRVQ